MGRFFSKKCCIVKKKSYEGMKANWEFLFRGADIDAFAAAHDIGIRADNAVRYRNREDIRDSYGEVSF